MAATATPMPLTAVLIPPEAFSAFSCRSSKPSPLFFRSSAICSSSFCVPIIAALDLFKAVSKRAIASTFWVSCAFNSARAFSCSATFFFCSAKVLDNTSWRARKASALLSFLSYCADTTFISDPSTLRELLISLQARLYSCSPSNSNLVLIFCVLSAIITPPFKGFSRLRLGIRAPSVRIYAWSACQNWWEIKALPRLHQSHPRPPEAPA